MQRKVNVVEDLDGNKIVFIHDIVFKGKSYSSATTVFNVYYEKLNFIGFTVD